MQYLKKSFKVFYGGKKYNENYDKIFKKEECKMKYKDKYDFAEKVVNNLPWIENSNIRVKVSEHIITYESREEKGFSFGSEGINASLLEYLKGIIDGLMYAYEILKREEKY